MYAAKIDPLLCCLYARACLQVSMGQTSSVDFENTYDFDVLVKLELPCSDDPMGGHATPGVPRILISETIVTAGTTGSCPCIEAYYGYMTVHRNDNHVVIVKDRRATAAKQPIKVIRLRGC